MYIFTRKSILFLLISTLLFFSIGVVVEKIIKLNIEDNQFQLQEDWHVKHNEFNEIVFIGNSRTWVQVDAEAISNVIHKKTYCLAQDGREAKVLYCKLKTYLNRNKYPKIIFIQFDPYFIKSNNNGTFYGKKEYLAYIYGDKMKINKLFQSEIGFNKYEEYIPLIRYFNTDGGLPILTNHLFNIKPSDSYKYKFGSSMQIRNWAKTSTYLNPEETNGELNFNYIDSIINLCISKEIDPVLIYPPQSFSSYNKVNIKMIDKLNNYALSRNLTFWNFNSETYNDSTLFYNHMHLNHIGAKKFTLQLIELLNSNKL